MLSARRFRVLQPSSIGRLNVVFVCGRFGRRRLVWGPQRVVEMTATRSAAATSPPPSRDELKPIGLEHVTAPDCTLEEVAAADSSAEFTLHATGPDEKPRKTAGPRKHHVWSSCCSKKDKHPTPTNYSVAADSLKHDRIPDVGSGSHALSAADGLTGSVNFRAHDKLEP
jgi:hypothetical protein